VSRPAQDEEWIGAFRSSVLPQERFTVPRAVSLIDEGPWRTIRSADAAALTISPKQQQLNEAARRSPPLRDVDGRPYDR
jgi:hypothetical protein